MDSKPHIKRLLSTAIWILLLKPVYAQEPEKELTKEQTSDKPAVAVVEPVISILQKRGKADSALVAIPFSIAQHRLNYILPVSWASNPNDIDIDGLGDLNLDNFEAKYQISIKFPLYLHEENTSGLYFGFTAMSFWQVYNGKISKPFRETNYEPEIFYSFQNSLTILGFEFNQLQVGFNHQSNGQSGARSRSWNRLFASALFSDANAFYYVKTWYRIPEDDKLDMNDTEGDDNPDITDFLGHIELGFGTKLGNFDLLTLVRNNLKVNNNKGSIELNLSYALSARYNLLLQYFNGYGDSLIDYNRHQQRIGLGVQLAFF
ncbi:phospholipase A [Paraglaciecola hydrolytica]|uniref:Phospholipase A1 n=1 Tax=Paraglaciecola hydrolytica TaxID=1799789 RepID=A0A136A2V1_9ALTE|nr:phospholipase A [Paraglaciecola hydrolytica]KXI29561.1 phospholipase [Paraglaciecola hydrolytica]